MAKLISSLGTFVLQCLIFGFGMMVGEFLEKNKRIGEDQENKLP